MKASAVSNKALSAQQGFTLIELSIVLVIIGLIVGGVLVGQDLIKAAQIRAEVTQLERYNTAVNTFRGKYNGLPGDLTSGVTFFGSITNQNAATSGLGNGDGLIASISAAAVTCATLNCLSGESVVFWYELNQANMIPDNTTSGSNYTALAAVTSSYVPNGKLAGTMVTVNQASGINYWVLANQSGALTAGVPAVNANALTVVQAYQIDSKIDDGLPATGTVTSIVTGIPGALGGGAAGGGATFCYDSTANTYQIAVYANSIYCQLVVRANF